LPGGIPVQAQEDILNPPFLRAAIVDILRILVPEVALGEDWTFDIVPVKAHPVVPG
jgi:hypothetical protein